MPYTDAQCKKFAIMAAEGRNPPRDWRKHCSGKDFSPTKKKKAKKAAKKRNYKKK